MAERRTCSGLRRNVCSVYAAISNNEACQAFQMRWRFTDSHLNCRSVRHSKYNFWTSMILLPFVWLFFCVFSPERMFFFPFLCMFSVCNILEIGSCFWTDGLIFWLPVYDTCEHRMLELQYCEDFLFGLRSLACILVVVCLYCYIVEVSCS